MCESMGSSCSSICSRVPRVAAKQTGAKEQSELLKVGSRSEKMKLVTIPLKVAGAFLVAPFRRLLQPRLRSTWNPRFETYVHLVKKILLEAPNDLTAARSLADRSVPNLVLPGGVHRFKERVLVQVDPKEREELAKMSEAASIGQFIEEGPESPRSPREEPMIVEEGVKIKCEWLWPSHHTPNISRKKLVSEIPKNFERLKNSRPVILYLHGGAFSLCSTGSHRGLLMQLALTCDCAVYAPNYRRPPETPLSHAVQDVLTVVDRLETVYGIPRSRIIVAGDSAGGALALLTMLELNRRKEPQFAAGVLLSPWVDLACTGDLLNAPFDYLPLTKLAIFAHLAAGDSALDDPRVSAINASPAELCGLPPLCVQAGEVEVLLSQISRFVDKSKNAGLSVDYKIYPDMVHAFGMFAFCHETAMQGITDIRAFIDRTLPGDNSTRDFSKSNTSV